MLLRSKSQVKRFINIHFIRIYSQLSLKILNNNTSLIFSKLISMAIFIDLLYLWKIKVIAIHQHRSFMMEIFIADPLSITNVFNVFFSIVAQKVQPKIKFSSRPFSDFLPPNIHESIILSQMTKDEISKIIPSLNSSKSAQGCSK